MWLTTLFCPPRAKNAAWIPRWPPIVYARCIEHTASVGCKLLQRGKNLGGVKNIIGTGGPLINNEDPAALLKEALRKGGERDVLLPETAALYADGSYMLYAMGLLVCHEPKAALGIMKKSLEALS